MSINLIPYIVENMDIQLSDNDPKIGSPKSSLRDYSIAEVKKGQLSKAWRKSQGTMDRVVTWNKLKISFHWKALVGK